MDTMKAQLLVILLTISVFAQWSMAAPLVESMEEGNMLSARRTSSLDNALRMRRSVNMETPDPAMLTSSDSAESGFLLRLRRSLAQMYAGSMHYNNHRHSGHRRHRRMRHRHIRHQRRHRGGRVVDA